MEFAVPILLNQDSARGSETCAAGDSPSAAPPTVAANSAEELAKLRKVERLRGENKQLNERLRFDPRQAVSELSLIHISEPTRPY